MSENNFLQDGIAVSAAAVPASANRKAKEMGVDAEKSLITVSRHLSKGITAREIALGGEAAT